MGDLWEASFHPGNVHPASVSRALLERAFQKLPPAVRQIRVRADSAFFNHDIVNFLKKHKALFAIAVIRRPVPEEPPWQLSLFQMKGYSHQSLVTDLPLTPYHVWRFYNSRATTELIIRELKEAYALGKIPTRHWDANGAYFHLVCFVYDLLNRWKRFCLPPPFNRRTPHTVRRELPAIPGELVRPHGIPMIRLPASYPYRDVFIKTLKRTKNARLPSPEEH